MPAQPGHPKHAASHPDHPRTVRALEALLDRIIGTFFATRIFGPGRAALLAAQLPATDADAAAARDAEAAKLQARIRRIETAQDSCILELEQLPADPADTASAAMRARIRARFADLHHEREHLDTQLAALAKTTPAAADPALLDQLPLLGDILPGLPPALKARLFAAFGLEILWNKPGRQVTVFAEITESTLQAIPGLTDPGQDGYHDTSPQTSNDAPVSMGHLNNTPRCSREAHSLTGSRRAGPYGRTRGAGGREGEGARISRGGYSVAGCGRVRFAGGMGIERFGAEDGRRADACYEIFLAIRAADDPDVPAMPPRVFLGWLQTGFMGEPRETWLLEDAAGVGGWYLLELPSRDNGHLGFLEIDVAPGRRRHGLGTALLRHAAGRAIADGRELLSGYAWAGSAGEAFARSSGAAGGQNEIRRAMDTGALSPERLAELRDSAQAASAGYSLVSWAGPTPKEHLDGVAALNRAGEDAPHDASHEELLWDAARVRATDQRAQLYGMLAYTVMARHDATGEPAGLTLVEVGPERPEWGFQALTAVAREHRGRRLGLRLKLAMLDLLARQEPQVKHILTSNTETNGHMIGINETLGYRVIGSPARSWELPAAQVIGTAQS